MLHRVSRNERCVSLLGLHDLAKGERRRAGDAGACALRHLGFDITDDGLLVVPEVLQGRQRCEELERCVAEHESKVLPKPLHTICFPIKELEDLTRQLESHCLLQEEMKVKTDAALEGLQRLATEAIKQAKESAVLNAAAEERAATAEAAATYHDARRAAEKYEAAAEQEVTDEAASRQTPGL